MRVWAMALPLLIGLFAGCLGGPGPSDDTTVVVPVLNVPRGASLEVIEGGQAIVWADVSMPFEHTFALPEGVTMVRLVADPGPDATVGVGMSHGETDRRRCNQQSVVDLGAPLTGPRSCGSIALIDPPGTEWTARATGPTSNVRIEFLHVPVDGPAGLLDLDQLSHATHDLQPTQGFYVPSFDGTELWVEVTLPEGEGPWPTVIAASPYNGRFGRLDESGTGTPAMWGYWTHDWAKRGYAAVNVDVRGFGKSMGCVEVWGENEQKDQAFTVDWVADQDWSDGNVGFYGQSYVGTTPVAAAVQAPEALKAIIAVAPVIHSYDDWHYGGVPNGESSLSPVAYQVLTDTLGIPSEPMPTDITGLLPYMANGICDPSLVPRANDPRAIVNEFYHERDFKARAGDVRAAVLYTQGFEDANVKSAMIPGWFNELPGEKLGVFGHWLHQHPARMDAEVLFLGWMDQHVKGRDVGFDRLPAALITAETGLHRVADAWPPLAADRELGIDLEQGALVEGEGQGSFMFLAAPEATGGIGVSMEVTKDLPLVAPRLRLAGAIQGENAFLYARLTEVRADGSERLLTWGMHNVAHRDDHATYTSGPLAPSFDLEMQLRPTEFVILAGSELVLRVQGVAAGGSLGVAPNEPAMITIEGAGSALLFPDVGIDAYTPLPHTARP